MKRFFGVFGIGIAVTMLFGLTGGHFESAAFGITGLGLGLLYFFIGLVMLVAKEKNWAGNFLLAGLLLFLIGATTCSTGHYTI